MRRFIVSLLAALALALVSLGSALGHVHGVTPLLCLATDNPMSGATGTNGTPADDATGGPITGQIPINLGNAPLTAFSGDAGRHAAVCD
jgi:hypothetical protein